MPKVKDPVCGMMCDPETSKWKTDFEGQTYHFCSKSCLDQFEANPEVYVKALASAGPAADQSAARWAAGVRPEQHEPPYTTKGGITAPKFGSATSGGGEYELLPEAHGTETKTRRKKQ